MHHVGTCLQIAYSIILVECLNLLNTRWKMKYIFSYMKYDICDISRNIWEGMWVCMIRVFQNPEKHLYLSVFLKNDGYIIFRTLYVTCDSIDLLYV